MGIWIKKKKHKHQWEPLAAQMLSPGGRNKRSTITFICAAWSLAYIVFYFIYKNVPFMRLSLVPAASTKSRCLVAILNLHFARLDTSNFQQWPAVCLAWQHVCKKKKQKKNLVSNFASELTTKGFINPASEAFFPPLFLSLIFFFFFFKNKQWPLTLKLTQIGIWCAVQPDGLLTHSLAGWQCSWGRRHFQSGFERI